MEKANVSKKSVTTVLIVWQLVTTLLIGYGMITPTDIQHVLSTADWMAASEIEINSSVSLLEKGYCLVNKIGSTVYAFNYTNGYLGQTSTNPNVTMQWALDNSAGVLIKAASYGNVVLTVKNGNHLIIEKNATTITASPAPGSSCLIEDLSSGLLTNYKNGLLAWSENLDQGTLSLSSVSATNLNST